MIFTSTDKSTYSSTDTTKRYASFKECLFNPIPFNDSLWFPDNIKELGNSFYENIHNMNFNEISFVVLNSLIGDEIPDKELKNIINETINFDIPLKNFDNISILELFHGPTLTFKDIGARFMARILKYFIKDEQIKIVVSTSGDTGSAVADAFYQMKNVEVDILYPKALISKIQEEQITSYNQNINCYKVIGNFDDCQDLVKKTLKDDELNNILKFFPANSINIARLLPQTLYYFWAYSQFKKFDKESKNICFCVPSGNLGNLSAGVIAYKLGLPVKHFIGGVNANDTLVNYLEKGYISNKRAIATISNAMDVSLPNNLKRLIYAFNNDYKMMSKLISSASITDKETNEGIIEFYNLYNYTIDPHTSVGYQTIKKFRDNKLKDYKFILLATAHPSKFPDVLNEIKIPFNIPNQLKNINKNNNYKEINNSYDDWKDNIIKNLKKSNITIIGMPGTGKTTVGKHLLKTLNYQLIDLDIKIEERYNMKLSEIISNYGNQKFKNIEEDEMLNLNGYNNIFSTGGSVVYSEKGMNYLKKISTIVFLDTPYEIIEERLSDLAERGVVFDNNKTLRDIFEERYPLYMNYYDYRIECNNLSQDDICEHIKNYLNIQ